MGLTGAGKIFGFLSIHPFMNTSRSSRTATVAPTNTGTRTRTIAVWCRAALVLGVAAFALGPGRAVAGSNLTCITFSDCDDGLFCTKDDCVFFICVHTAFCPDDGNACTLDCSESQNRCLDHIPAPAGTACGLFDLDTCDGAGNCTTVLACDTDVDCQGVLPLLRNGFRWTPSRLLTEMRP